MSDNLKPDDRRRTMQAVKSKGTRIERRLFALLARNGISGWKKNLKSVLGKPDVVFLDPKLAIFIDGCFWHGCPYCRRKLPETNKAYWKRKIKRNIELALHYNEQLNRNGWTVIRIWEHEIDDVKKLNKLIKDIEGGQIKKRVPTNS